MQKKNYRCLPHVKALYDKAKLSLRDDNLEMAYTYLRRAADIGEVILKKPDFSLFCKTTVNFFKMFLIFHFLFILYRMVRLITHFVI